MTIPKAGIPKCIWDAKRLLGEGSWWSDSEQTLYWLDIKRPAILRCNSDGLERIQWPASEKIGCFSGRKQGGFIGGFQSGLRSFELGAPGSMIEAKPLTCPAELRADDRFNDGKCSPDGSFWAGTMDDAEMAVRGYFYRLDASHDLTRITGPHMVCNGPAFSPDGTIVYFTDSSKRTIYRSDISNGAQIERFITFNTNDGYPDGMTTDTDGRLWIAFWDGAKVMCLSPSGERLLEIRLPVSRPTSCAFGGKDLSTLYITSASIGLDERELEIQPFAGGLFSCEISGAKGWPAPEFAG